MRTKTKGDKMEKAKEKVKEFIRLRWELAIILIGVAVMIHVGAVGQLQKLVVTAVTVAIAMFLAFIASKKFGAEKIEWRYVSENTKAYFRLGLIVAFLVAYAIISNSFAVRLGL